MQTSLLTLGKAYFRNFSGLPIDCWKGIILNFIAFSLLGVFYFLSTYFVNSLHFSISIASIILSFYGFGAIFGGIIGGKLSDKLTPTKVTAYSLLFQAIGYLIFIKITSFVLLATNAFVLGLAVYSFITANSLYVLQQCHENTAKLKVMNLLTTGSNLGFSVSALLISITAQYSFYYVFLVVGLMLLSLSIYQFAEIDKYFIPEHSITDDPAQRNNKDLKLIFLILTCVFFIGMIIAQLSSTYPIYIENKFSAFGIQAVSILFMLNALLVVFLSTPIGNFVSRFNKLSIVGLGGFLIGFGMFLLNFSSLFILAIIASIIYTVGEILFFNPAQLICYQQGLNNRKGHSLGIFRTVYASSRVAGPALGGFIYSQFGGNIVWLLSGIIGGLCLVICLCYKK